MNWNLWRSDLWSDKTPLTSDQDLASDASAAPCSVEALEAILAKMKQILGKKRFRSGLPPDAQGFFQDRVLRDSKKK